MSTSPSSEGSSELSDTGNSSDEIPPFASSVDAEDDTSRYEYTKHLSYVQGDADIAESIFENCTVTKQLRTAPLFTGSVHMTLAMSGNYDDKHIYPQFALLGAMQDKEFNAARQPQSYSLVYSNTSEPWSAFICGSQGSGKSHTLSCLLENNLMHKMPIGSMQRPATGMVFHYDKFTTISSGSICEAAYLCTSGIPVQVLVAPTSLQKMRKLYTHLPGVPAHITKPRVAPLYFKQEQLSTETIMSLMAVTDTGVGAPLYINAFRGLLRQMALEKQDKAGFDYQEFLTRLNTMTLTDGATAPLQLRLELLRSILLDPGQTPEKLAIYDKVWDPEPGTLTIIDLSDSFINESDACALFSICLKLFIGNWQKSPRIVALDEAHKFLTSTTEASQLINDLVSVIRQQRHLSSRVLIATQEPTVSGELLDLCNVSVVHRFNSPKWFTMIQQHLAGATANDDLFREIVDLMTGEALVFCPTAALSIHEEYIRTLRCNHLKLRVRTRLSSDGGKSILPSDQFRVVNVEDDFQDLSIGGMPSQAFGTSGQKRKGKLVNIADTTSMSTKPSSAVNSFVNKSADDSSSDGGSRVIDHVSAGPAQAKKATTKKANSSQSAAGPSSNTKTGSSGSIIAVRYKKSTISETELRSLMYECVKDLFNSSCKLPKDPSGYIVDMLKEVASKSSLPKDFLLEQKLESGCKDKDAKTMMKTQIKKWYNVRNVAQKNRGPNWLIG